MSLPRVTPYNERTEQDKELADKNDKKSHEILRSLYKIPGNSVCADCTKVHPGWAALPHGVFICIDCAQIHRHIGRHISQVKSISTGTYLWFPDEIEVMKQMGNKRVDMIYLGGQNIPKPNESDTRQKKEAYIRDKYEHKKWFSPHLIESSASSTQSTQNERPQHKSPRSPPKRREVPKRVSPPKCAPVSTKPIIQTNDDIFSMFGIAVEPEHPVITPTKTEYQRKKDDIMSLYNQPRVVPSSWA